MDQEKWTHLDSKTKFYSVNNFFLTTTFIIEGYKSITDQIKFETKRLWLLPSSELQDNVNFMNS